MSRQYCDGTDPLYLKGILKKREINVHRSAGDIVHEDVHAMEKGDIDITTGIHDQSHIHIKDEIHERVQIPSHDVSTSLVEEE